MAMDKRHKRVLQQNTVRLTDDLEPINLLGYLYQEGVILEDDMDRIRSKLTRKLQAEELLRIIPKRGAKAFDRFCDVLYKIDGQRHLAKMLKEDIESSKGMGSRGGNYTFSAPPTINLEFHPTPPLHNQEHDKIL